MIYHNQHGYQQHHEQRQPSSLSLSWGDIMARSTIYDRHEMRRFKTLQLQDDPRPAVIRVLSGLPGFRRIILPYQPSEQNSQELLPVQLPAVPTTVFNDADSTTIFVSGVGASELRGACDGEANDLAGSNWILIGASVATAAGMILLRDAKQKPLSASSVFSGKPSSRFIASASASNTSVPLLNASNSAAVAFLTPAHYRHHHTAFSRIASVRLAHGIVLASLLGFIGYRNFAYPESKAAATHKESTN